MEFFCNFIWETGFRAKNEDSLCVRQITKDGKGYFLGVICDGIGGLSEGENASSYVVNSMVNHLKQLLKKDKGLSVRQIRSFFCRKIYQCHKTLQKYGKSNHIMLGTTMSMIFIRGNVGYVLHIGDSCVFGGKKRMKRITPIQSTCSGALMQAIGVGKNPKPFFRKIRIQKNMVLLLASDGFYRRYEDVICSREWINQVVADEKKIKELLMQAKEEIQKRGEKDNISAIGIKVC